MSTCTCSAITHTTPSSQHFRTKSYTYDSAGNITSDGESTYTYDTLDRLTGMSGGLITSYAYDVSGNRTFSSDGTSSSTIASTISYTPNTLNEYSQITMSGSAGMNTISNPYDANGNLRNTLRSTLTYDAENRLTEADTVMDTSMGVTQYRSDALGRRIAKITPTGTRMYVYAGDNAIQEIVSETTTESHSDYIVRNGSSQWDST